MFFNQVDLNTDLLDNVILQQVVIQPTKKLRSVGPHKPKLKTITYKRKLCINNKKFRSAGTNQLQQHLFYTNKDLKNYAFIDVGTSILIVTWKITKNHPHIISQSPFSSCSSFYGSNQRSERNDESSSIPINDIELFYCLIGRLLFTRKITTQNVQDGVTSLLITM